MFFLRYHFFRLAKRASPSQDFLDRLETKLFPRIDLVMVHRLRWMRFAVVPALIVVTILSGTGVYAYSSDTILPDHALYPLRQGVEGLTVQVAAVTGLKDRVRIRQIERHAREKILLEKKQAIKAPIIKPVQKPVPKIIPKPIPKPVPKK